MKCVNSTRFVASSLSNRADNLTEGNHKIKCKKCDCFFECESFNENLTKYKCYLVIDIYQTRLMKN